MRAIADTDLPSLQAIARQLLAVPTARLPRIANLASRVAPALSAADPELAVALFRRCSAS